MSKFVQVQTIEPLQFDGDTVSATLKPMPSELFLQLLPTMQEMEGVKQEIKARLGTEDEKDKRLQEAMGRDPRLLVALARTLSVSKQAVKESLVELKGLTDASGKPVDIETVLSVAYFFPVALHLVQGWVAAANVKEGAAGESARPSAA